MNPMRRARYSVFSLSDIRLMSAPSTRIRPESMVSSPLRQLRRVVLPQPEGPMMATISPRWIARLTPPRGAPPPPPDGGAETVRDEPVRAVPPRQLLHRRDPLLRVHSGDGPAKPGQV